MLAFASVLSGAATVSATLTARDARATGRTEGTGTASLRSPDGCVTGSFRATVSGRQIANASFFVDGRKVMTVIEPDSKGRFTQRVDAHELRPGVHRVRADVVFSADSATASRRLIGTFQRCRPAAPKFTG